MKYCLIVPHYNHDVAFATFLPILMGLDLPCIIVDDGSDAASVERVREMVKDQENIHFFEHGYNRGKGAAVMTGCVQARHLGFTHGIQIDADGQHDVADVAAFIALSQEHPTAIVSGHPQFDDSAPKSRVYGRKVTDFWVILETLSLTIKDSLCGFRVYPINEFETVFDRFHIAKNMGFDTDMMVKSVWLDIPIKFVPTKVIYPEYSVSHFHYLRDNVILIQLHTRLMLGMLFRSPLLITRLIKRLIVRNFKRLNQSA